MCHHTGLFRSYHTPLNPYGLSLDSANRRVVLLTSITFTVWQQLLLEEIPWRRSEPCGRDAEVSSKSCALFFIRDRRSLVSMAEAMTFTLSSRE